MRGNDGAAAQCILDALGAVEPESTSAAARLYVGALVVVDIARELTNIRRILVKALSG